MADQNWPKPSATPIEDGAIIAAIEDVTDAVVNADTHITAAVNDVETAVNTGNGILTTIDADTSNISTNSDTLVTNTTDIPNVVGTHDSAVPTKVLMQGQYAESTVPTAVADGDAVRPWYEPYGRPILYGSNLSEGSMDVTPVSAPPMPTVKITGITQLTAPGNTAKVNVSEYSLYGYSFTVAAINSSVLVCLYGSIDETNYAVLPLDSGPVPGAAAISNNQVTVTANGTYLIYSSAPVIDFYFSFVSESGGSAATIDCDLLARRI